MKIVICDVLFISSSPRLGLRSWNNERASGINPKLDSFVTDDNLVDDTFMQHFSQELLLSTVN
jgi:hypothetical protein